MGESVDPKKLLLPYLQRADELQKHEPLVAYYCRLYAMERGLKIPSKDRGKTVNALLISLMNQLEKDKKTVKLGPEDNLYFEGFAARVFTKADKQDRAGRADINTAKTFYAASLFFEVLHQFGEVPPDIEQRQKYAIWKAADIRKALSEGRKPIAGPPGGDEDLLEAEGMTWDTEGSPPRVIPGTNVVSNTHVSSSSSPEISNLDEGSPHPAVGAQLPRSDSSPQINPFDSLPRPPSTIVNPSQSFHHTRGASADDIDLPSAPTQPVYPGVQHVVSPSGYQAGFPAPYSSTHYSSTGSVQDADAPPPPIHDWSGAHSHRSNGPGGPQSPSPFVYPAPSNDEYNSNAPGYSTAYTPSTAQSSFANPTNQNFSYPQYPTAPAQGYHPGNTYSSVSPSQNYTTGYAETHQHQGTVTPAAVPKESNVYSNGSYRSDSGYQPPPDKVAEAHKAARFAVSSLAFDDVPTALEFLRKSLELLTVPSQAH